MNFSIRIKRSAARELQRLGRPERTRVAAAIDRLADNPYRGALLKGDLQGLRRLRVGDYRILYEVQAEALIVLVLRVAHRQGAYRRAR